MAKFDVMTCNVALGGDVRNVVHMGLTKGLTWAEVMILQRVHGGPHNITELMVAAEDDRDPEAERERLRFKYSRALKDDDTRNDIHRIIGDMPTSAPTGTPRFDDEVVVEVRKPRKTRDFDEKAA